MPNYYPAPAQPYPIGYLWAVATLSAELHGSICHSDKDSKTAKPDKFTGRDPSKLRPFVVNCIMAFDSQLHKFATDRQRVSYTAPYLSDITMLWWQPILVAFPELSICNDWGEFVDQLSTYFGQPDLAQASEPTLCALKIQDYQHVNKYMIEFSEHATIWGRTMRLYMVSSIGDLLSASKTSSCRWTDPKCSNNSRSPP